MIENIRERRRIAEIVARNPELRDIAVRLKALHEDRRTTTEQINIAIQQMNLPISKHLFVTGNYSTLVSLDY